MDFNIIETIKEVLAQVTEKTQETAQFLCTRNVDDVESLRKCTKHVYDSRAQRLGPSLGIHNLTEIDALPELIVDGFDDEQVWQEIELHNNANIKHHLENIAKIIAANSRKKERNGQKKSVSFADAVSSSDDEPGKIDEFNSSEDDEENEKQLSPGDSDEVSGSDFGEENSAPIKKKSALKHRQKFAKKSVVDDKFFRLSDMDEFLTAMDRKEERKNKQKMRSSDDDDYGDSDIDYFKASDDDEMQDTEGHTGDEIMYSQFFDPPPDETSEKESDNDDGDDDILSDNTSSEEDNAKDMPGAEPMDVVEEESKSAEENINLSTFEKTQQRMRKIIAQLESDSLSEKTWQLKGEVTATSRPENSLLEEALEFEQSAKPKIKPVAVDLVDSFERLVRQRRKDMATDSVERQVRPANTVQEFKKRIVVDQEKSKLSLAEVYEQDYLAQNKKDEEEKIDPKHEVIKKSMQALFRDLDALSNYHYTPKQAIPEVKIITNLPSILLEEVTPATASDAVLLAPEEVQGKTKRALVGDTEKSKTDMKRARRIKKKRQHLKKVAREERDKAKEKSKTELGIKDSKKKAMKDLEKKSKSNKGITLVKEDKSRRPTSLTSSSQFFKKLQDEVTTHIEKRKAPKPKQGQSTLGSKKLKL